MRDLRRDRRSTSTTLGYVLTLGIATVLVTGLLVTGGNFVADERQKVIESELEAIGQQVAAGVESTDRLVEAGKGSPTVRLEQHYPGDVTGSTYRIRLVESADPYLTLTSTNPEVSVKIEVTNRTSVGESTADGGTVVIEYDGSDVVIANE